MLPESLAHRLQCELNIEDQTKSNGKGRKKGKFYLHRQLSADTQRSDQDLMDENHSFTNRLLENDRDQCELYQNSVRDYRASRSATDSIEEQASTDPRGSKTFIRENLPEDCNTTCSSDGAILETHL